LKEEEKNRFCYGHDDDDDDDDIEEDANDCG